MLIVKYYITFINHSEEFQLNMYLPTIRCENMNIKYIKIKFKMLMGVNVFDHNIASCILKKGKETNTNKYYSIRFCIL